MKKTILIALMSLFALTSNSQNSSTYRITHIKAFGFVDRVFPINQIYLDSLFKSMWNKVTDGTPLTSGTGVPSARTLTINGVAFDLSANRSWTVGDVLAANSYSNPSFIASLAWAKISSTPTTLAGYGITDAITSASAAATYVPITGLGSNVNFNNKILTFNATATGNGFLEFTRTGLAGPNTGAANTLRVGCSSTGQLSWTTQNAGSTDGFRRTFVGNLTGHRNFTLPDADGTFAFLDKAAFTTGVTFSQHVSIITAGKTLQVKGGTNGMIGTATFVGATVTVANTSVTANSRVFMQLSNAVGPIGHWLATVTPGVGIQFDSDEPLDVNGFWYFIVEQQ